MKDVLLELRDKRTAFMRSEAAREIALLEKTADALRRAYEKSQAFDGPDCDQAAAKVLAFKNEIPAMDYLQALELTGKARKTTRFLTEISTTEISKALGDAERRITDANESLATAKQNYKHECYSAQLAHDEELNRANEIANHPKLPTWSEDYGVLVGVVVVALFFVRGCTWVFQQTDPSQDRKQGAANVGWFFAVVILLILLPGFCRLVAHWTKTNEVRAQADQDSRAIKAAAANVLKHGSEEAAQRLEEVRRTAEVQLLTFREALVRAKEAQRILSEVQVPSTSETPF